MVVFASREHIDQLQRQVSRYEHAYDHARAHLFAFEFKHWRALITGTLSSEAQRLHEEHKRYVTTVAKVLWHAKQLVRIVLRVESYDDLPLPARIIGEVQRPLMIVCYVASDIGWWGWMRRFAGIVVLLRLAQSFEWLPLIAFGPWQVAFTVLYKLARATLDASVLMTCWQEKYLGPRYHRSLNRIPDGVWGVIWSMLADTFWLVGIVAVFIGMVERNYSDDFI